MSDRREFISALTLSLAGLALPPADRSRDSSPEVRAEPTIFYGHPDGRTCLVRFVVQGLDAPAGRLRVFADGRRLVGTAGVLRSGESLLGELWLPLTGQTTVTSVLEAPGLREPHWTTHRLSSTIRWTIVWLTPADPRRVGSELMALPPVNRAIQTVIWREAGVRGNPLPTLSHLHLMDHTGFLRIGAEARWLETECSVPASAVGYSENMAALPPTTILALAGSGVRYLFHSESAAAPLQQWTGPDGSQILTVQVTPGGDPRALGFAESTRTMTSRLEDWLSDGGSATGALVSRQGRGPEEALAFLASGHPDGSVAEMVVAVQEWNRRYAYPRILVGDHEDAVQQLEEAGDGAPPYAPPAVQIEMPTAGALGGIARDRSDARSARLQTVFHPLAQAVDVAALPSDTFTVIARSIETSIPGYLVLNPTPFRRTDAIQLPSGHVQIVTDVPALGYTFMLEDQVGSRAAESPAPPSPAVVSPIYRLELDRKAGSITALVTRSDGREWVRGDGLNAVRGAILEGFTREVLPGVGVRLTARRWSSDLQEFQSTYTVYDSLPWIDIENHVTAELRNPLQYRFDFVTTDPQIRWEIPAGHRESAPPVEQAVHLRWLAVRSGLDTVLFSGLDAPHASVRHDGTVTSFAPSGRSRYRIRVARFPADVTDCARFGWGAEPFMIVPVSGIADGSLPRFGPLLILDQPTAAIVGLKVADDGNGVIVYVQELLGQPSILSLGPGLLRFNGASKVDFLERDMRENVTSVPDGLAFQSRPWGITALRLQNVRLNGG